MKGGCEITIKIKIKMGKDGEDGQMRNFLPGATINNKKGRWIWKP